MISCRNVARLLTSDELAAQSRWKRMEVRLHLAMCKFCSRLARQLELMRIAARRLPDSTKEDKDLEERLARRLFDRM